MNLLKIFKTLKLPRFSENESFVAEVIPGYPKFRIAINTLGLPTLLLNIDDDHKNVKGRNTKLKYLLIQHDLNCKTLERNISKNENLTAIKFLSTDPTLQNLFFTIAENLILSMKENSTTSTLLQQINKFAELFRAMTDVPKKTIQGLWGELLLIERSIKPQNLVDFWHNDSNEKFDFNSGNEKVEVKTSSTFERIHFFSAEQLDDSSADKVLIASIFLRQSSFGLNIFQLCDLIRPKVANNLELMEKITYTIFHTLGDSLEHANYFKYDYTLACESLVFYDRKDIVRISLKTIPKEISNIKYQSDLSAVPPFIKNIKTQTGQLISSCL